MARNLGSHLDTAHADLPMAEQRLLRQYEIGADRWDLVRTVADPLKLMDDRAVLTPDMAMRIPDQPIVDLLHRQGKIDLAQITDNRTQRLVDQYREDLANRMWAMFSDRSRFAMITPGIETKVDLLQGTRPGTPEGELLRAVAVFKSWPAAMVRMGLGREVFGRAEVGDTFLQAIRRPAVIGGILHMGLAATVLGYLVMSIRDILKGREPRDPLDYKTWIAAALQGGGAGILGDFLFGEYSRTGNNPVETLAGPLIGGIGSSVVDLWNRAKNGDDFSPAAYRFVFNNMPFINLAYTRLPVDYLFNWQVQEALNPGAMHRFEQKVLRDNRQRFWISPSAAVGGSRTPPRQREAPPDPWGWTR